MTTFNDNESGASVRAKINAAITTVDGLGSTAPGAGAALVRVEDASGNFAGTNVEAVLAEINAAIPKVVALTQTAYDALTPDAETVYLITDAG